MTVPDRAAAKRIYVWSVALYFGLWLAELLSKIIAVRREYTGDVVKSSLTAKIGEALKLFGFDALLYGLTLILIYVLFALLNGHYASLAAGRLRRLGPAWERNAPGLAFLAVNGVFLFAVYALNSTLYPASGLAILGGLRDDPGAAAILKIAAAVLLGLFLLIFVVLDIRWARKGAKVLSLAVWIVLLLASLDPGYLARRLLAAKPRAGNAGPNVILIGLDSLNPRHTGYFGYPLKITPNVDAFLAENTVFSTCYTPIARTFPAWYSILTGQYPRTNGVRLNLVKRKYIRSAGQGLAQVLRTQGYKTLHFTDEVRFSNITEADGFDRLRHPPMGVKDFLFGSLHDFSLTNVFFNNRLGYALFPFSDVNRAVAETYDGRYFLNDIVTAIGELRSEPRFLLAVHLCLAHWPYIHASPRALGRVAGADPLMELYDSAVAKADGQFGRIITALKETGLYDDSLVVVFSDHGESAEGHGSDLRDLAQNRVLLAWKPPGPPVHRQTDILSRTIDIAPTVLDLLGQAPGAYPFDGQSLTPWIGKGDDAGARPPDSVFLETEFSLETPGGVGRSLQAYIDEGSRFYEFDRSGLVTVRDDLYDLLVRRRNRAVLTPDWMLAYDIIIRNGRESTRTSLFDIRRDPGCRTDVAAGHPDELRDLLARLRSHYGDELPGR
ncbi:MAG TPA: sulfatase-like hydrolase/transferase [Acidobacteriota bacterium]|nr:sulfatase-like hydrolase/transferase [Acidobacteriota bacterium]